MEVDYLIVGAGTAGCVLANRLSADSGVQVLLVEAGGSDWHPLIRMPAAFTKVVARRAFNWNFESEPEPALGQRRIAVPRGRVLGGSSSINGLFHIRGDRRDFDDWAAQGCTGWGYDDVLPYFKRSEASWRGDGPYHGGGGAVALRPIDTTHLLAEPLRAAAAQAGHRLNDDSDGAWHDGFARGDVAIDRRGRRHSSARAYLHPVRQRANLQVWTGTLADRLLLQGRRVQGLRVRRGGQTLDISVRRELIVCAGTYGSPQLLLRSGIGPGAALQALGIEVVQPLAGVGENLIEHPRLPLMLRAAAPVTFLRQLRWDRLAWSALRWAFAGRGPLASQICNGTLLLKTEPGLDRPDIQLLCNPVRLDARPWFPGVAPAQEHAFYVTVCLLYAKSRGTVRLHSSDPAAPPRISFNLFSHADDFAPMRAGLRAARYLYAQPALAALVGEEMLPGAGRQSDAELDEAIRALAGITHHPVGTCAMGHGPQAVVDPQLRVHGIAGLRIADASVMPGIVGGNTNAATLMIGEKAADLVRGRDQAQH